jgi:hypothetical protein
MQSRWITYLELAQLLKIAPSDARRWADEAHLPESVQGAWGTVLVPLRNDD